jgi:hypothetical protein
MIHPWVKTYNEEPKRVLDMQHNQSKSNIPFLLPIFETIVIMAS